MFNWFNKGDSETAAVADGQIREIGGDTDLEALLSQGTVILFKHSTACPTSWAAHLQVMKFTDAHPDFPVNMVPVIQQRATSNKIAERTGVRHESPQIILLPDGKVVTAISHGSITLARLAQLISN